MSEITTAQLDLILSNTVTEALTYRPETGRIFYVQYATGLRIREVLEVERWTAAGPDLYEVQVEKGSNNRTIDRHLLPAETQEHYDSQTPFPLQTYSAVNNCFKYYTPGLIFDNDKRRTTTHAFRYLYIKKLVAAGRSITEIAAEMGHENPANTAAYAVANIQSG